MVAASWLLLAMAIVGASDVFLYHVRAQRIREQASCRNELLVHFLRGPTYFVLFLAIPNLELRGAWVDALLGLLLVDLLISIADFALEKESRAPLGGLPTGEYLLHVLLAVLFGAFVVCVVDATWAARDLATSIAWAPAPVPDALRLGLAVLGLGVLATGFQDLAAALRLTGSHRRKPWTRFVPS